MSDRWLTTFTGARFFPTRPEIADYRIADIAHALANTCRFGGHCPRFYSVAQHSILVSRAVPSRLALWGLLHDASEAYLCDLPTGVKYSPALLPYRDLERRTLAALMRSFGLESTEPAEVKEADRLVLRCEANTFGLLANDWDIYALPDLGWCLTDCWDPERAEREFLARFVELDCVPR
jgi:uncharacterized protein